jgi:PPP family 3-phenylpropionic acid transporter
MTIFSTGTRISALFAASFVTLGVQLPFFPVLLAHRGMSDTEIAVIVAAPMILRVTTVSFLGAAADRVGDRRRVLMTYAGLALAGCLALGPAEGFAALFVATVAMALFWNGMLPVTDALATTTARRGEAVYGRMRLWGSVTFVAANLTAGQLVGTFGGGIVYPLLLAGFVLQFAATPLAPRLSPPASDSARPSLLDGLGAVMRDRWLMTVLAGAALVQASHAMLYGFSSLYWASIGFSGGEIGALWAVSVVGEVILFAYADRAIAAFGARGLLLVGGAGAVVRWCLFPVLGDSGVVWVALQLSHAASFAATHLGTMHVVTHAVGEGRAATVQGLTVTLSGTAMAISTLASGVLYARFGGAGFLGMAVAAGLGTMVLVAALGARRRIA